MLCCCSDLLGVGIHLLLWQQALNFFTALITAVRFLYSTIAFFTKTQLLLQQLHFFTALMAAVRFLYNSTDNWNWIPLQQLPSHWLQKLDPCTVLITETTVHCFTVVIPGTGSLCSIDLRGTVRTTEFFFIITASVQSIKGSRLLYITNYIIYYRQLMFKGFVTLISTKLWFIHFVNSSSTLNP